MKEVKRKISIEGFLISTIDNEDFITNMYKYFKYGEQYKPEDIYNTTRDFIRKDASYKKVFENNSHDRKFNPFRLTNDAVFKIFKRCFIIKRGKGETDEDGNRDNVYKIVDIFPINYYRLPEDKYKIEDYKERLNKYGY